MEAKHEVVETPARLANDGRPSGLCAIVESAVLRVRAVPQRNGGGACCTGEILSLPSPRVAATPPPPAKASHGRQTAFTAGLSIMFSAVLAAGCGGGGDAPPAVAGAPAPAPITSQVYIGYYVEDAANNPEDPTVGAMLVRLPSGDASFAGQMPFSYAGCSAGADIGAISGTRTGTSLSGNWTGMLDGNAVGGGYSGNYDAANDRYSGTYANSAGKQVIAAGPCSYFVAAQGSWRLFGGAASEPAGFALTATNSTTPTIAWSGVGAGLAYTVRVFDYDCLNADITSRPVEKYSASLPVRTAAQPMSPATRRACSAAKPPTAATTSSRPASRPMAPEPGSGNSAPPPAATCPWTMAEPSRSTATATCSLLAKPWVCWARR